MLKFSMSTILVLLFVAIVPYNLYLMQKMWRVQTEALDVNTYLQNYYEENGVFPEDLSGFVTESGGALSTCIAYTREKESYVLTYFVGTPTTSHFFRPRDGWNYYPD